MIRALRRLWTRAHPPEDRRRACRYSIADAPVFLGWWEGDKFRTTTAMLVDLSVQGASVLSQQAPAVGPVWLCPYHSSPSNWAEGTAIAVEAEGVVSPFRKRWYKVRLELAVPCSFDLFKSGTGTGHKVDDRVSADDVSWGGRR